MENLLSDMDLKNLVQELSQGRELAEHLHIHLLQSSSHETGEVLLNEILNSFDQVLFLVNHSHRSAAAMVLADPQQSLAGILPTDISDHESKDQANRKRRWRRKVEVCGETGIEGQLDDGYGWRKYGQKDILGAKYPRGYYRCAHRYGRGCLATKQIQRSDDDPNTLDITYCGMHTCDPFGNPSLNDPLIPIINPQNQLEALSLIQNNHHFLAQSQPPFFDIQTSLKGISQDIQTSRFPSSSNIQPQNFTSPDHGKIFYNLHGLESEPGGVVPTSTTSVANSSALHLDFPLGMSYEFGLNFSFEDHRE